MTDNLTPHGVILEAARERLGLTKRAAAKRADYSESRWRQIVTGVQKMGGGVEVPARPTPKTLRAMSAAVDADVNQVLIAAGFEPVGETAPENVRRAELRAAIVNSDEPTYLKRAMLAMLDDDQPTPDHPPSETRENAS